MKKLLFLFLGLLLAITSLILIILNAPIEIIKTILIIDLILMTIISLKEDI